MAPVKRDHRDPIWQPFAGRISAKGSAEPRQRARGKTAAGNCRMDPRTVKFVFPLKLIASAGALALPVLTRVTTSGHYAALPPGRPRKRNRDPNDSI